MNDREVLILQLISLTRELRQYIEAQGEDGISSDAIIDELIQRRGALTHQLLQACENVEHIGGSIDELVEENHHLLASVNREKSQVEQLLAMQQRKSTLKDKYHQLQSIRGHSVLVDRNS
ncbi:hypothetical protein [Desulfurispira natronophila]|uniref:Regulator of replication initiation timing n=1 Tax=Desulfurispira natronophila TaxID=682562 RepID=A0A7W8DH20_9BACT|nr:hypothetical protein [Desulfurispira natronophila]MBB5022050.1 regulator of replication initiation timing [Desulfurispira natronophila]